MTNQKDRLLFFALLLIFVIGLSGGGAVLSARQERLKGALNGLPDSVLPHRTPVMGVNVSLEQYDPASLDENLTLIKATGFVYVRQVIAWDQVETESGQYDWSIYDPIIQSITDHNLSLVAVLYQSDDYTHTGPPDTESFADFARTFAERYGDQIQVYQIWDEPNLAGAWGEPASPVGYSALLEASYNAIHDSDSDAFILTAGLAPTIETGPDNLNDILYLRALYDNGAAPFFDGVAGKPYGFDTDSNDRRTDPNLLNFSRFLLLRQEMERGGDRDKPLWASHFGWNALPQDWTGDPSAWGQTSPEMQASQTVEAYERVLSEWAWSGAFILDNWQPAADTDDPHWGFALRGIDGTLSPTAEALAEAAPHFNESLWSGVYLPNEPRLNYSGDWKFSDLGADFSETGGSVVDVPFTGDRLAAIIRRDHYRAHLYVEVDGEPSQALPQDEDGAYLVLTSPDYKPRIESMILADNLNPDTSHTAHIEAVRGWDQWALVGFSVGASVDTTRYDLLLVLLSLLTLGSAIGTVRIARRLPSFTPLKRLINWLATGISSGVHLGLSLASALALWLAAALTWGGLIPDFIRRIGDTQSLLLTAFTAGVFYYSPWFILTLIALTALVLLIYARPAVGLALIIFFSPYYLHPRPLFDRAFSMVEVVSLITLAVWIIHTIGERKEKGWTTPSHLWKFLTPLDKGVLSFVILSIAAITWSDLVGVAATEIRQMVIEPAIVYLILRTYPFTDEDRWRVVDLFVLTGLIIALIGLYQIIAGVDFITAEGGIRRLRSVYNSPNSVALYLGRVLPLTVAVALIGGKRIRRWFYGGAGLIIGAAAVLSLSKGGLLLGIPAGLAVVVILWGGRKGIMLVGGAIVLELLALIPLSRIPRFQGLFDFTGGDSTSFFRVKLWQSAIEMIKDHPLTGVGPDQFLYAYRGRYILPEAWQEPDLSTPHNFILSYWIRLGVFGVAAGLWIQAIFWKQTIQTYQRFQAIESGKRAMLAGLMGGMAAFIAHGMVDEAYYLIDLAFVFFMMLGLAHQLSEEANNYADGD